MLEEEIKIIDIVLNNKIWHEDTKKVYLEMIRDEFAEDKPIYVFNKKTEKLEKLKDTEYYI